MKIVTVDEALEVIKDNSVLGLSGSGGWGGADELLEGLGKFYEKHQHPRNLTIFAGITPGDLTTDKVGMNNLIADGLVGKAIAAHFGMARDFGKLVGQNKFPAYGIPLGVFGHLLRVIAGGKPGIITPIGLDTFVDPRIDGCAVNEKAKTGEKIVKVVKVEGEEYLYFKAFPINVCFIKGTFADKEGNISLEKEAVLGEQAELAFATHNSGGTVIVQVEKIVPSLKAKTIAIPAFMVDYVVIASPKNAIQGYTHHAYHPELCGEKEVPLASIEPLPLNERKICGRRAILELKEKMIVNLGIGMPEAVARVASEEEVTKTFKLSVEMGPLGGVPVGGVGFGASINPEVILKTSETFDFYDGGGLDLAILGLAQVDALGNVNVSKFGPRITGPGGFINITQSTKKVIFLGTLTTHNLRVAVQNQNLQILNEGEEIKFVKKVEQITFSAKYALKTHQEVLYITERAVFKLTPSGLELIEMAPGIDLEKDILANMEFKPIISPNLKLMDKRIFTDALMCILHRSVTIFQFATKSQEPKL